MSGTPTRRSLLAYRHAQPPVHHSNPPLSRTFLFSRPSSFQWGWKTLTDKNIHNTIRDDGK